MGLRAADERHEQEESETKLKSGAEKGTNLDSDEASVGYLYWTSV